MAGRMPTTFLGSISGSNGSYTLSPSGKNSDKNGKKGKNGRKRGLSLTSKGEKFKRRMWDKNQLDLVDDTRAASFASKWEEKKESRWSKSVTVFGQRYGEEVERLDEDTKQRREERNRSLNRINDGGGFSDITNDSLPYYWKLTLGEFPELGKDRLSDSYTKLFEKIYLNSVQRNVRTRVASHPIETGEHRHDMKVYEPMTLSARGFLKLGARQKKDAYDNDPSEYSLVRIRQILDNVCCSGTGHRVPDNSADLGIKIYLVSPLGGIDSCGPMTLESYTISADQDKVDVFAVSLTLKEVMLTSTRSAAKTSSPEHASTASR